MQKGAPKGAPVYISQSPFELALYVRLCRYTWIKSHNTGKFKAR